MKLMLANPRGFCAGVDRAIDIVNRALEVFGSLGGVLVAHPATMARGTRPFRLDVARIRPPVPTR